MPRDNGERYEESFKKETVKYIIENNKSVAQVGKETGVNQNTLYGPVKKFRQQSDSSPDAELRPLQK